MDPRTVAAAAAAARAAHTGGHTWTTRLRTLPSLASAAFTERNWRVLLAFAGIVYAISPIDILPEILLGPFGLGDDLAILTVSLVYLVRACDRYLDDNTPASNDIVEGVVISRADDPTPDA